MWRHALCAVVTLAVCVGLTMGDEIRAIITKVDGTNVTFAEAPKKKGDERGKEQTLPAADTIKVNKGVFNKDTKKLDAGDAIETGLKNEMFSKIDDKKGMRATVITDADNKKIIEIRVGGGKGK